MIGPHIPGVYAGEPHTPLYDGGMPVSPRLLLALCSVLLLGGVSPTRTELRGVARSPELTRLNTPYRGVDASFVLEYERAGMIYRDENGDPADPLRLMADHGANLLRLRLFTDKPSGHGSLSDGLVLARRAKALGMDLLLDFHYSDDWADPGKQFVPAAWAGLTGVDLEDALWLHTFTVLEAFEAQGTPPQLVQIGNEVSNGMLWPFGSWNSSGWEAFTNLLKAGIDATETALPAELRPKVIIHHDKGANTGATSWFFDNLVSRGVAFDVVGLSYYPWWHGSFADMRRTTGTLAERYARPVMIVETAYPWSLGWQDSQNNFVWQTSQLEPRFSATSEGQTQFLDALSRTLERIPEHRGLGWCYWAPEFVAHPGLPSPWENLALFDFSGSALPAMEAFAPPRPR
ncbi:MAG: arabinogalactan endo-1,4-beta-galactosidase [Phycisphaerales bacterium]|jgi:arabinogalactan endo-1,4-beta-galactosidase